MKEEKEMQHTCVDCGTQNCKFKVRTYPEFCPTTNLKDEDLQWALERYEEGRNHDIMVASAEVEFEGYCQWTRVQEIMEFARKIGAKKIGIANCIGLINEARIFAKILRANGFEAYAIICKVAGKAKSSIGIPEKCEEIGAAMCNPILSAFVPLLPSLTIRHDLLMHVTKSPRQCTPGRLRPGLRLQYGSPGFRSA